MANLTENQKVMELVREIKNIAKKLRELKPGDRSDLDRKYAICVTEVEKTASTVKGFLVDSEDGD